MGEQFIEDRFNRMFVCHLDVLGFENKFNELKLGGMLNKYLQLINIVNETNKHQELLFEKINFDETAYWTAEKEIFIAQRMFGAYASDSILVWTQADFPANRYPSLLNYTQAEYDKLVADESIRWQFFPIPCELFLDQCNEIICHSIEIGLPLRGAISMGEAVLHIDHGIYLGQPLIEAARLEHNQNCMGASFANSFMSQVVPGRYKLTYDGHFKSKVPVLFSGCVLDWPRHWRNTRTTDLKETVEALKAEASGSPNWDSKYSIYYDKTLEIIDASFANKDHFVTEDDMKIAKVYPQFSNIDSLKLKVRLVRCEPNIQIIEEG